MVTAAPRAESRERARASAHAEKACLHCGLPVVHERELGLFCCAGCKNVHALLYEQGLERFYELRGARDAPQPRLRPDSFAWLDPLLASATPAPGTMARLSLDVQGVHCAACVWLLQELWRREAGALDLRVNPALGRVEFLWNPAELDLRRYLGAALRFGYRFGPRRKHDPSGSRALVVRLGVCAAIALNTMMFSLCFYFGLAPADGALYDVLGRWNFALATLAVLCGGSLFVVSAWRGLARGVAHIDLPIAVGIVLGYGGSVWAWLAVGPEAAYFDTIAIFVALMVLGRWLQERVLERNRLSLLAADGVDDLYARRCKGDVLETISASAIESGDELWIPPGDLVPVRGILLGERATMSLDWITGESRPRAFEPGDSVPAGAFHAGATAARLAAAESFDASRLHALLGSGERSREIGADPAERWWSRFATIYVGAVLLLAAAGFALWIHAGLARAIEVALSVLVVTCPCALGLALPLANELVHVALRRQGIFLREAGFLRRVLRVRHVLFDKTGTLTRGNLKLGPRARAELAALAPADRDVLAFATAQSLHPVSRAVHAELEPGGRTKRGQGLAVREIAGRGLEARDGVHVWRLGHPAFALERGADEGGTCFSRDGERIATFDVDEELAPDARDEILALERAGLRVHLLSGDRAQRVRAVARELGLAPERAHGDLAPEEKARYVRRLEAEGTWMIGDGINDGLAFDAALCAATPAVDRPNLPARADFFYLGDGVGSVRVALGLARRLARVTRTNLALAVLYNVGAVTACLLGYVGPIAAAVLMPASSLGFLSLTTLRLQRGRPA